jgi:hypothetical protein
MAVICVRLCLCMRGLVCYHKTIKCRVSRFGPQKRALNIQRAADAETGGTGLWNLVGLISGLGVGKL